MQKLRFDRTRRAAEKSRNNCEYKRCNVDFQKGEHEDEEKREQRSSRLCRSFGDVANY